MCLAFPTSASQRQVAEQRYEVVPPQLITAVHAVRPGRYNILFFRDTVDQHIEEATDHDSIKENHYVEKNCWEHVSCLSKIIDLRPDNLMHQDKFYLHQV